MKSSLDVYQIVPVHLLFQGLETVSLWVAHRCPLLYPLHWVTWPQNHVLQELVMYIINNYCPFIFHSRTCLLELSVIVICIPPIYALSQETRMYGSKRILKKGHDSRTLFKPHKNLDDSKTVGRVWDTIFH